MYGFFLVAGPVLTFLMRDSVYVTPELRVHALQPFRFWQNIVTGLLLVASAHLLIVGSKQGIALGVGTLFGYSVGSIAYGVISSGEWRWEEVYTNNVLLFVVGAGVLLGTYYYAVRKR